MLRACLICFLVLCLIFFIDQFLKEIILSGFRYEGEFISIVLTFNDGVAFSMFAFLGIWLKYFQLILILCLILYFIMQKNILQESYATLGILLGAASSNLYDRFIHGGVVDYVFWHKWFEFAVFNFADVMIDFAVGLLLLKAFLKDRKCKETSI